VQSQLVAQQALLEARLSDMYKLGDYTLIDVILSSHSLTDAETQLEFFHKLGEQDRQLADRFQLLTDQQRHLVATIDVERAAALRLASSVNEKRLVIAARLAQRRAILNDLDSRIKKELARQRAIARRQADLLASQAGIDLGRILGTDVQLAVVREAMQYLGVPYLYGGAAPQTGFDCSGLVMYVYARFGVNLPHFAAYQADLGVPVPFDQLEPADLVFFGSPIHHVGMYVGNGRFIEAPHTGDVVKISVLTGRSDLVKACRYPAKLTP